jgi:hypothetical protein
MMLAGLAGGAAVSRSFGLASSGDVAMEKK